MEGKTLLDRYQIAEQLGQGGRGAVYRAWDPLLERDVAVKIILPKVMTPEARKHFRREARTTASLEHPAIATVYDFGQHERELFLVMPLLPGRTLRHLIEDSALSALQAVEIAIQVADALDYSHQRGVIHRDIKPENVMVDWPRRQTPHVKVLDFGLATEIDAAQLASAQEAIATTIEGTLLYLSPEQLLGETVDLRVDLYALGMMLHECLTGEHPLKTGESSIYQRILFTKPRPLREKGVEVSGSLDRLIRSCIAKEASQRPACARDVLQGLVDARRALEPKPVVAIGPRAPAAREHRSADPRGTQPVRRRQSTDETPARVPSYADRLGDLLLVQGEYLEAQEAYRKARERQRAEDGSLPARVETRYLLKLAQLALRLGRYEEALDRCRQGLDLAGESPSLQAAKLSALASLVCCMGGRYSEANRWLRQARNHLRRAARGDADSLTAEVLALRSEGNLHLGLERPANAVTAYRRALAITEQLDDRWEHSIALFNLGEALAEAGEIEAARDYLRRAIEKKSAL
ncbi:MAG: serine/threonine-protein kinase, partial [Acidobacteriota bacterium]